MLTEYTHLEPQLEQMFRRWLGDGYFDLYLWYDTMHELIGWQLCYGKPNAESAITWRKGGVLEHQQIDDGESSPGRLKRSPVLLPPRAFDPSSVARTFEQAIAGCDDPDVRLVLDRLRVG